MKYWGGLQLYGPSSYYGGLLDLNGFVQNPKSLVVSHGFPVNGEQLVSS